MLPRFDSAIRALASSITPGMHPDVDSALGCSPPAALEVPTEREQTKLGGPSKPGGTRAPRSGRSGEAPPASTPDTPSSTESAPGRFEPEGL
ncbi:MAG: hypothetical protein HOV80_30605 [Polyangiaceae bacterium]|nr:hypothetical protein [Polyangiaceae bacterium]